jgi:hydrogenase 3 maturation protease
VKALVVNFYFHWIIRGFVGFMDWDKELFRWLNGSKRVLIVGIGNPYRGDDDLGNRVVELMKEFPPVEGVVFLICETVPESFTGAIKRLKPDRIIVVDAAEIGTKPGQAIFIAPSEVKAIPISTHNLPISLLTEYLQKELNADIMLLAIQPKDLSLGYKFSSEIETAVREISKKFFTTLKEFYGEKQRKAQ